MLVAHGFQEELYAHVARLTAIKTFLAVVVEMDLELHQMDAETIFLNGSLPQPMYMYQEGLVCILRKTIYELKEAPRRCNKCFSSYLERLGFILWHLLILIRLLIQFFHAALWSTLMQQGIDPSMIQTLKYIYNYTAYVKLDKPCPKFKTYRGGGKTWRPTVS